MTLLGPRADEGRDPTLVTHHSLWAAVNLTYGSSLAASHCVGFIATLDLDLCLLHLSYTDLHAVS